MRLAPKLRTTHRTAKHLPERLGADRFLVRLAARGGSAEGREPCIVRGEVRGEQVLVAALGINGLLPHLQARRFAQVQQGTREQGVGGTIGREDEADGFERLADDQSYAVLGRFQEEMTVNGRREAGDDNRRDIFERKFPLAVGRFAGQLPILATERALRRINADDVVGHAIVSKRLEPKF